MNYRIANILSSETHTVATTKVIDILDQDPISRIEIKLDVARVAYEMVSQPAVDMAKIELVDGSTILASLNGYECQALNIYNRKCASMNYGEHYAGNGEKSIYGLDFGRWLWDPVLALDPKRFKNLQLKITFTLTGCDASAVSSTLEVLGYFFDEKVISPIGMLVAKEHYSYTPSASAYHSVLLPQDMPIRKMLIRAYQDGATPWDTISNIRLDESNLKRTPIDIGMETYYRFMRTQWTPIQEAVVSAAHSSGRLIYVTPTQYYHMLVGMLISATGIVHTATWQPGGKITITSATAFEPFSGIAWGFLPNHCVEFPFGDQADPNDWYDITKAVNPRLRLLGASSLSSPVGAVVLDQLMRY